MKNILIYNPKDLGSETHYKKKESIEYPAFIYKKNGYYMADCLIHNLVSIGITESDAISNLEKKLKETIQDKDFYIKFVNKKF